MPLAAEPSCWSKFHVFKYTGPQLTLFKQNSFLLTIAPFIYICSQREESTEVSTIITNKNWNQINFCICSNNCAFQCLLLKFPWLVKYNTIYIEILAYEPATMTDLKSHQVKSSPESSLLYWHTKHNDDIWNAKLSNIKTGQAALIPERVTINLRLACLWAVRKMEASCSSTECGNQKHLLYHLANALFNRCEKWDLETWEALFKARVSTIGDRMGNGVPTLHFYASSRSDQKHLPGYFHSCARAIIELSVTTFSTLNQKKKNDSRGWSTTNAGLFVLPRKCFF